MKPRAGFFYLGIVAGTKKVKPATTFAPATLHPFTTDNDLSAIDDRYGTQG